MSQSDDTSMLESGLSALDLTLSTAQIEQLLGFIRILAKWNKTFNLTSIRDPSDMIVLHLLDSLAVISHVWGNRLADVGTGAGLPGIPLAIALPDAQFLLIDSNGKKTRFVNYVCGQLGLSNVEVFHGRVQDYSTQSGFDTVVCRAVATLSKIIEMSQHLLCANGLIVAQKGRLPNNEMASMPSDWAATKTRIQVPFLEDQERHLVILRRARG